MADRQTHSDGTDVPHFRSSSGIFRKAEAAGNIPARLNSATSAAMPTRRARSSGCIRTSTRGVPEQFQPQFQTDGGHNVDVVGGAAGRHDQYYGLQFGRANDWKVKLFFTEIPHVFTNRYKSLWNGVGTAN